MNQAQRYQYNKTARKKAKCFEEFIQTDTPQ